MIISPWAYLPFHVGHSFPLTKWMGSSDSGRLGQIIMLAFNITLYLAEHWTRSFPGLSQFVYDVHLHEFSVFMMLSFFYFSYYNSGKHQSLVRNWFFATLIFMWINASLDIGMPKKTMEEQIKYIEGDEVYNIAHFIGHVFLFVMAWHVSSVVDVTNGLKKGWIVENEKIREWVKSWNEPAESPKNTLKVSLAVCGVAAAIAVVIEILEATFDGSVPMYPQPCRAVVTNDDQCSFLGISIPCHRVFRKEALNHFGVGLTHHQAVLWGVVLVLVLYNKPLSCIEVGLALTTPAKLDLESLEVSFALDYLDERLQEEPLTTMSIQVRHGVLPIDRRPELRGLSPEQIPMTWTWQANASRRATSQEDL